MSKHRRRVWFTFRRLVPFGAIVAGLATFALTYPHGDGLVIPPAQGTYENFEDAPSSGPTGVLP